MTIKGFEDAVIWAERQWGEAQLGDKRRTKRAVQIGRALAEQPAASLPAQTGSWRDLKAAYRLLNEADVTHQSVTAPHFCHTKDQACLQRHSVVLFIQDTSDLNFSHHPNTRGLGYIGDGRSRGLMLHTCLAVVANKDSTQVLGLAAQRVWTRKEIKGPNEKRAARWKRWSESEVWAEVVERIGQAPVEEGGPTFVSVGDCASDFFGYWRRAQSLRWHCLSRIKENRAITTPKAESAKLIDWARSLPQQASKSIRLRAREASPARDVKLKVAYSEVTVMAPRNGPDKDKEAIRGWVVRCWEESRDDQAIEWILLTTIEVDNRDTALEMVQWYSCRWIIEEYYKCLKTGCRMQQRQLESRQGLEALLGFLAVVAVRLLQLRALSRTKPEMKAKTVVPEEMIEIVRKRLGIKKSKAMTVGEFWEGVGRMGGFIGRKSDGEPGWQTLWGGWQRLQDICWGATLFSN